ncbi:MAG: GAF domain-containing protein [Anaerolineae bacterium]
MTAVHSIFPEALDLLYQATLAVAATDTLPEALQQIADSARRLVDAEYAAIGAAGDDGRFQTFIFSGMSEADAAQMAHMPVGLGLLGAVMDEKSPIRIPDIEADGRSVGFPAHHPPMDSFLGVPIILDEKVLGNLYLTNKLGAAEFSLADERLVQMLAAYAATALHKMQLIAAQAAYGRKLSRRNQQLRAMSYAAVTIAGELTLEKGLLLIVDAARELIGARYAALGVPGFEGSLETFVQSGMSLDEVNAMPHWPEGKGLLGIMVNENRSIRVKRIQEDPRSVGFPANHPPMSNFMGVPIMSSGRSLGSLYFADKENEELFTADDQELAEMFAEHAAVVIQNAQLYEQVGRLAVVGERARIGMDLHDGIIQSIYAVGLNLESIRLGLSAGHVDGVEDMLDQAVEGLNDSIRDIRNFILDLRPHRFSGNLNQGISRLVREFQANTMVSVVVEIESLALSSLPTAVARAIFLTTQEALANIARHARAKKVTVSAKKLDKMIEFKVADDGRGFDVSAQNQTVGHGLSNMRARAESLNGSFTANSAPNEGATIILTLPR